VFFKVLFQIKYTILQAFLPGLLMMTDYTDLKTSLLDRLILLSWHFPQRLPRELPEYSDAHRKSWFCTYWPCYNKNAIRCNS